MFARSIAFAACFSAASAAAADPSFWKREFPLTDFGDASVSWSEIISGGPPKDGIPAIDDPAMIDVSAEGRIGGREPVIAVEIDGSRPRAYPIRYLTWHEIVNDEVDGTPIAVTFCPLCNSGPTFDRRVDGATLTFGVSGKLRNSDMIMFDRETESWWQQAVGTGIVGLHNGVELTQIASWMESWDEFRARNPDGLVMDRPGWPRPYGRNPYVGYDGSARPFLYDGEMPPHGVPPLVRVVRVGSNAWPLTRLREEREITEDGLTISWTAGQASALAEADIASARDVGSVRVKDADGNDLPHDVMFAFAFHAFFPEGTWKLGN